MISEDLCFGRELLPLHKTKIFRLMKMNRFHAIANFTLVLLIALSSITACAQPEPRHQQSASSSLSIECPDPLMGEKIKGEKTLKRAGYWCSYNTTTLQSNYVSWVLTPEKLQGTVKRDSQFYEDPDLGMNEKALLSDYYNSGYDRGHMCPAADNKWDKTAMMQSFYLSNMCPQNHNLNEGDWEQLESACRTWVRQKGVTLYITCGPIFDNENVRKLKKHVWVPAKFFKAVVCLEEGQERGIAFVYDNKAGHRPMEEYACSVSEVEKLTGLKLFADLSKKKDAKIVKRIKTEKGLSLWSMKRK